MDQSPSFQHKKQDFEQKVARLCGQQIASVRYHDIIDEGIPNWNYYGERFDNPIFAVEFIFEDSGFLGITWGSDFTNYNLVPYATAFETEGIIDVTSISRWSNYLHQKILSVTVYWGCWITGEGDKIEKEDWFPEELELTFEDGEGIVISAAQVRSRSNGDELWIPSDEIIIIFDDAVAAQHKMGRYFRLAEEDPTSVSVICNPPKALS